MALESGGLFSALQIYTKELMSQALLARLGYYRGDLDGQLGSVSREAILAFQRHVDHLEETGNLDADTWGMFALAAGVAEVPQATRQDGEWLPIPGEVLDKFDHLCREVEARDVSYGPGRGKFIDGRMVVTQGPYGLSSARYKTKDKRYMPAFVCNTWIYFVACYLLRVGEAFNKAMASGRPCWDWLQLPEGRHPHKDYGTSLGFGPYFRMWTPDGSSAKRKGKRKHFKKRKDIDLLEYWDRYVANRQAVPEIALGAWASSKRGFYHHCTAVRAKWDGDPELWFVDAGGSKSKAKVFSGTDMAIDVIRSREEAQAAGEKGWGQFCGLGAGTEVLNAMLERPEVGLGFEMVAGKVTVVERT